MNLHTEEIQKLKEECAETEAKIEQLRHQNERLKNRERYLTKRNPPHKPTGFASRGHRGKHPDGGQDIDRSRTIRTDGAHSASAGCTENDSKGFCGSRPQGAKGGGRCWRCIT